MYNLFYVFDVLKTTTPLNIFVFIGYIKIFVTVVKYYAQLRWNYERKRTKGWPFSVVALDLAGTFMSLAQVVSDMFWVDDFKFNIPKILLSSISILVDIFFCLQEYHWFGKDGSRYAKRMAKRAGKKGNKGKPPKIRVFNASDADPMETTGNITKPTDTLRSRLISKPGSHQFIFASGMGSRNY